MTTGSFSGLMQKKISMFVTPGEGASAAMSALVIAAALALSRRRRRA